jgi:endo-1,4-beta-xylanase
MDSDKLITDTNKDKYTKIIPYVFDSITCENNMKPDSIRTDTKATIANYITTNSYDYSNANAVINFAKTHNMKMLGHVLWYDSNVPKFVKDLDDSRSLTPVIMSNIFNNHISNVISHFDNQATNTIYAWQVTNEALDPDGTPKGGNIGKRIIGDSYFTDLFVNARSNLLGLPSYDSNTKTNIRIIYNDTDVLSNGGIFNTLKGLKNSNYLHGIGLQCHNYSIRTIDAITLKYINERFEVHFTEVDFPTPTPNDTGDQVTWFTEIIRIALKYGVRNFTVWGLTDDKSWRKIINGDTQYPLLFDSSFQPKNCYNALITEMKLFGSQIYDIFIVLGQSNSCGRGSQEYTFDNPSGGTYDMKNERFYDDDFKNNFNENIRAFSYDNRIVPAFERLDNLQNVGQGNNTYGFGLSFARQYVKENKLTSGRKVLLIGCGWGGTGSSEWAIGASSGKLLYKKSLKRIQTALDAYPTSEVKGILWHQGESDAGIFSDLPSPAPPADKEADPPDFNNYPRSNTYKNTITTMLNLLRTNISRPTQQISPSQPVSPIPILMGGLCPTNYIHHAFGTNSDGTKMYPDINNYPSYQHRKMTRFIEQITKDNSGNNYKFVSAERISSVSYFNHYLKGDATAGEVHFNKSSQIEFGKRYFYVYNNSININGHIFNFT